MATAIRPVETQEQESNLKAAMLAKTSFRCAGDREPLLITAGDCGVFFTAMLRDQTVVRFTLEEWEQITEFVETQLLGDDKPESWEPDWSKISLLYKYVAMDESGKVFGYQYEPRLLGEGDNIWRLGDSFGKCGELDIAPPTGIHWTQSLRARPSVSL